MNSDDSPTTHGANIIGKHRQFIGPQCPLTYRTHLLFRHTSDTNALHLQVPVLPIQVHFDHKRMPMKLACVNSSRMFFHFFTAILAVRAVCL